MPHACAARSSKSVSSAINPTVSRLGANGFIPSAGTRPQVGLNPAAPQNEAGRMVDPAVCEASASGTSPPPTAAADPADEPPGVNSTL